MTFSELAFNHIGKDDICMCNYTNNSKWKDNILLTLSAIWTFTIATGDDTVLQQLYFNYNDNYDIGEAKDADVASVSWLYRSPTVWHIVNGMRIFP